jgi:hypothetical protein
VRLGLATGLIGILLNALEQEKAMKKDGQLADCLADLAIRAFSEQD